MVKRMKDETNASIYIDDSKGDPVQIRISGSKESVARATHVVRKVMEDNSAKETIECPLDLLHDIVANKESIERDTATYIFINRQLDPAKIEVYGGKERVPRALQKLLCYMTGEKGTSRKEIKCPKHHIGSIVGFKGSTIREIEMKSGATVDASGREEKITICGNKESVDRASQMVRDILDRHGPPSGPPSWYRENKRFR